MRKLFIVLLLTSHSVFAQQEAIINQSRLVHKMLTDNDALLEKKLDENLTYGHSNGWIETKQVMLDNLKSGKIKYINIKEDSMTASVDKKLGYVRFVADMNVVLDGKQSNFRLKVLEVWRKKSGAWKLYARQAVRA